MRIAIIGTGYQGLVTGTCLAENGHRVICMDRKADPIALLKKGCRRSMSPPRGIDRA